MPNRILREGINSSEKVEAVSESAELFYRRIMSIVDDYGRFSANPTLIRSAAWPLAPEKHSNQQIEKWLAECAREDLLVLYVVGSKKYFEIREFRQQRRSKSKYPSPPDAHHDDTPMRSSLICNCVADCQHPDACLRTVNEGLVEGRTDSNTTTTTTTHSEEIHTLVPFDSEDSEEVSEVSSETVSADRLRQRLINIAQLLTDFMGLMPDNGILMRVETGLRGAHEEELKDFLNRLNQGKFRTKGWPYIARTIESEFGSLARQCVVTDEAEGPAIQ